MAPRLARTIEGIASKLEPVAMAVLIPLFFSYTGIRTDIGLLGSGSLWLYTLGIIAVAVAEKRAAHSSARGSWDSAHAIR